MSPSPRSAVAAPVALSAAQQRLWVLSEMRPHDPFYNIPFAVDIDGPLDVAALQAAVDAVVRRHPALRSSIRRVDGELVAVADPPAPTQIARADLGGRREPARSARAAKLAAEFAATAFDLAHGPLFRTLLVSLDADAHRLAVNAHHIVFDGWSLGVFMDELVTLYEAFAGGLPSPLPDLPVESRDDGRAGRCAEREPAGALDYWTARLAGAPEVMELPISAARPASSRHEAAHRSRLIPPDVIEPLRLVARRNRATMFMVLKAACDVLLRQHGARDVVMGVALSGRDTVDSRRLVGYLAKPVLLRCELHDDPSFSDLLARVRGDVLDAHDHPDVPFEAVLKALDMTRDPSYYPLSQVMFGYEQPPPARQAAGAAFSASYLRLPTAKVELEFMLTDTDAGLRAELGYRADLFDAVTIDRMLGRLQTLLERIGRDPGARVSDLTLPSDAERHQVVEACNATRIAYPHDRCIHELVEDQVQRSPDAVAVQAGQRFWSYRELDEAANQVAHHLRALGVAAEQRVGICLPRSLELLAALLGVLKAGGVYVPLDPGLPALRLGALIEDASVGIVLADPSHAATFEAMAPRVVRLDTADRWIVGDRDVGRVASSVVAANAAYILFTSGSTGGPKGVVLEHRNLNNLLTWAHRELGVETFASVPLISSLAFDVSMFEIFTALTCGGKVVMAEDAFALARTPGADSTTILVAVPSVLTELLKADGPPPSARTVISNGEVLPPSVLRDLYATATVDTVYNMYAPTETTTFSLYNVVHPDAPIPIGRPMDNTVAYVLDALLRPVAPGIVGQLHLGGAGITRGYLNRPGLTAERFVPDPFCTEGGQRLYATGDMVRHAPDGRLLFVGRADHQVKLRGCRIELGELEATLLAHSGVGDACAMVSRGGGGDELVAAVAAVGGATLSATEIRTFVQDRLPGYMVPVKVAVTDELPRLSSGKLDRKRILQRLAEAPAAVNDEPPADGAEQAVGALWATVLGRAVGVDENFFDAGGNSLLLVRLREELRAAFRRDVHVIDLFRHPTVRAMASFLAGVPGEDSAVADSAQRGHARQAARRALAQRRSRHVAR